MTEINSAVIPPPVTGDDSDDSDGFSMCKAAIRKYMEDILADERYSRLRERLEMSIDHQSDRERGRARVVVIDVDETGIKMLGDEF